MYHQTKRLLLILAVGLISVNSIAQNTTLIDVNADLRAMFSPLDKPANPLPFLYDMAGHKSDSSFFTIVNIDDTLETDMWYSIYEEMYHSAYDTSTLITVDDVINYGNSFYADTIPIAMMNYKMYTLKDGALTTNVYFDFDTINDVLTDKYPRPSYPYDEGEIFVAAPTIGLCRARDPFFRIDPR